jgi:CheY-like chemotaxis protein
MNISRPSIRVACVEDDPLFQAFLKKILVPEQGFELLEVFNNAEQAVASILDSRPDVVLLDMKLPGKTGIECLGMLESHMPATAFVMLTGEDSPQQVFAEGRCLWLRAEDRTDRTSARSRACRLDWRRAAEPRHLTRCDLGISDQVSVRAATHPWHHAS